MINSLVLQNFRCFETLSLQFEKKHILLSGSNGQGKSSVLEAVFFLANLRSFRTARISDMFRIGTQAFRIQAAASVGAFPQRFEIEQNGAARRLRIDTKPIARSSDFCGGLRTIAFLPDDPLILTGSSQQRRRFFDMFISMMDREYFRCLQKYSTALKTRNLLLREQNMKNDVLDAWDEILAENGSKIVAMRKTYSGILADFMRTLLQNLRPEMADFKIQMRHTRETETKEGFRKRLAAQLNRDRTARFTSSGPHADDFDFLFDNKSLRVCGSRGQCRIISFAMKMAELEIVNSRPSGKTIVLIDDAAADLDQRAREAFYSKIESAAQIFHASTDPDPIFNAEQAQIIIPGQRSQQYV